MATPHFRDVRDVALIRDDDLLSRVESLLERAMRRQVWLMFLDEHGYQLPVLLPSPVPRRPGPGDGVRLAKFFRTTLDDVPASSLIITYERPGRAALTNGDLRWIQLLREACLLAEIPFRGPLLCHDEGVRWVPADECMGA